jgi:ABC-2 type transport system ATP-binding protein
VKAFSGGMQRRLNLAAALVHDPQAVFLDEPTAGVDPQSRTAILDAVRDLAEHGRTVVYTTHYMEEAERICSRIAVIDHGRVLASGTAAELASVHAPGTAGATGTLEAAFLALTGRSLRD